MVCNYPEGYVFEAKQCQDCRSYHATSVSCLDAAKAEAYRLLKEKTEQFIEMSKRIEKLEDQVTEVCKEQRIFDKALDLATATTTFRNWLLERAKQELESET